MCLLVAFQYKGQAPPPNMQHHWVRFRPQFKYGRHPNSKDSFHLQGKIWFGVHKNNMIRLKIYSWHRETATLSSQFTTHVRINAITLTLWSLTRQHIFIISLKTTWHQQTGLSLWLPAKCGLVLLADCGDLMGSLQLHGYGFIPYQLQRGEAVMGLPPWWWMKHVTAVSAKPDLTHVWLWPR